MMSISFDWGSVVIGLVTMGVAAVVYFVRTTAESRVSKAMLAIGEKVATQANVLASRIDAAAIAVRIAEERHASTTAAVHHLESEVAGLVDYCHEMRHEWVKANAALLVRFERGDNSRRRG